MKNLNGASVEKAIMEVLETVTHKDLSSMTMDTPLTEVGLTSIQIISVCALLEGKLGDSPNFRKLIGMKTIGDILSYYMAD